MYEELEIKTTIIEKGNLNILEGITADKWFYQIDKIQDLKNTEYYVEISMIDGEGNEWIEDDFTAKTLDEADEFVNKWMETKIREASDEIEQELMMLDGREVTFKLDKQDKKEKQLER